MLKINRYNRESAIYYAQKYALVKNPKYDNFSTLGGNCTNYISQCLYAGAPVMNYSPNGWYYKGNFVYSPSWTSVESLYTFLTTNKGVSVFGEVVSLNLCSVGDLIQLRFKNKKYFSHTLIITKINGYGADDILVCANSKDVLNIPLSSYIYEQRRCVHILGYRTMV